MKKLMIFVLCVAVLSSGVYAWWDSNWDYNRDITITDTSGNNLADYPHSYWINHQGNANADCSDIRVVNETELAIQFAIRNCNTTHVEVVNRWDVTASSSKTYEVYYGNSGASAGNSTWNDIYYNFWDDFNDNSVNASKWIATGDEVYETGGVQKTGGDAGWFTDGFASNFSMDRTNVGWEINFLHNRDDGGGNIDAGIGYTNFNNDGFHALFNVIPASTTCYSTTGGCADANSLQSRILGGATSDMGVSNSITWDNNFTLFLNNTTGFLWQLNGTTLITDTSNGDNNMNFTHTLYDDGQNSSIDDVMIRMIATPIPTTVSGTVDQNDIIGYGYNASDSSSGVFYELYDNPFTFNISTNASVSDASVVLMYNGTNYTMDKDSGSGYINFTDTITPLYLFSQTGQTVSYTYFYNISLTNGTLIETNTTVRTDTSSYSYTLNTFSADDSIYLEGENIVFTLAMTNVSNLATINSIINLNNTNTTTAGLVSTIQAPAITPLNETFNASGFLSVSYGGLSRDSQLNLILNVWDFNMTSCNDGSPNIALVFRGYDERLRTTNNFTMGIQFDVWAGGLSDSFNMSFSTPNTTQYLCINPIWANFNINATIDYLDDPAYHLRSHLLYDYQVSNVTKTVSLYLLNTTYDEWHTITITDPVGNPIENVIVIGERWYAELGDYIGVVMGVTDGDGKALMNFEDNTAWYRFVLVQDGVAKRTTPRGKIDSDRTFYMIENYYGSWYNVSGEVTGYCDPVNASDYLLCTIYNNAGVDLTGRLQAWEMGSATWTELCDVSAIDDVMTLACLVGNTSGKIIRYELTYQDANSGLLVMVLHDIIDDYVSIGFGEMGVLASIFIIIFAFMIGIFISIDIGLIMLALGIITSNAMGFLQLGLGELISGIAVILLVLIIRGTKK